MIVTVAAVMAEEGGRRPRVWWVNQGRNFESERAAGHVWSPVKNKEGTSFVHWSNVREVREGDVLVHHADKSIRAVGRARADASAARRPKEHGYSEWENEGFKVEVDYHVLGTPIGTAAVADQIRALNIPGGPIESQRPQTKLGYMWRFSPEALAVLWKASKEPWPDWAEAALPLGQQRGAAARSSWVFQCNPRLYDAEAAVGTLTKLTWRVSQFSREIRSGDAVFLWQSGEEAKLVATATVGGDPGSLPIPESELPFFLEPNLINRNEPRVWLERIQPLSPAVTRAEVLAEPALQEVAVFKGVQGTNFRLTDNQATALRGLISRKGQTRVKETAATAAKGYGVSEDAMSYSRLTAFLCAEGLTFSDEVVSNYLLALQTKRFVILTGISGTGKTQLALGVARYFRQEVAADAPSVPSAAAYDATTTGPQTSLPVKVLPYHHTYSRTVIPVALTKHMQFAPTPTIGKRRMRVHYPGGTAELTYSRDVQTGRDVTHVYFKEAFKAWFDQNLKAGDYFYLSVVPGKDEDSPDELRFSLTPPDPDPSPTVAAVPATAVVPQLAAVPVAPRLRDTYALVAVRPDWTDHRGLLGFYNPLTEQYRVTPFLRLLLEAAAEQHAAVEGARPPHPYFAILDEMNLARVEHYFADFLSALESEEPLHLHDSQAIEEGEATEDGVAVPRRLSIPDNLFFTGTVNVDETTYMFSPKVLDRAFTLEFNSVDLERYGTAKDGLGQSGRASATLPSLLRLDQMDPILRYEGKPSENDWNILDQFASGRLRAAVVAVNALMMDEHRHFGYRVANEIARFVHLAADQVSTPSDDALMWAVLDLALLQKVLPKLHGTQQELEELLTALFSFAVTGTADGPPQSWDAWILPSGGHGGPAPKAVVTGAAGDDGGMSPVAAAALLPRTAAKLWRMLRRLHRQGFTSFME